MSVKKNTDLSERIRAKCQSLAPKRAYPFRLNALEKKRYGPFSGRSSRSVEEERLDDVSERIERLGAVDGSAQMGAVLQPLCIPGREGAKLVDHPAVVTGFGIGDSGFGAD